MTDESFLECLKGGQTLFADGATGTNLLVRGLPRGVSSEQWVLDKPDEILRLEREFIQAGAKILLTCTFGANPFRLDEAGLTGRSKEINRQAVELAQDAARDHPVFVAGSMGPLGKLLKPYGPILPEEAVSAFMEQAQTLSEAGADLIVIETQFDISEATAAVRAARAVSDLPLVVSFSYDRGTRTMMGVNPTKMAAAMQELNVDVLGINCGRSLEDNYKALLELRQATNLPIWFKPNAGLPEVDEVGNSRYSLPPKTMGEQALTWVTAGAAIIGGCCGTTPEHLKAIVSAVQGS